MAGQVGADEACVAAEEMIRPGEAVVSLTAVFETGVKLALKQYEIINMFNVNLARIASSPYCWASHGMRLRFR
jgi:hypothetical protein